MTANNLLLLTMKRPLILASGSPRRLELLKELGLSFSQVIPEIDETQLPGEPAEDYALRVACLKAICVASKNRTEPLPIVLACDTIVILNGTVLGKPRDSEDAARILKALSGHKHTVSTAVALAFDNRVVKSAIDSTIVHFNQVSDQQISRYIETKEPADKAGAYGIQGMGSFLVDRIEGKLDTVIGLPCDLLEEMAGEVIEHSQDIF